MSILDTVALVVHQVFGALWIGSVVFVAVAVLPLARDGTLGPGPLETIVDRVLTLSRVSALLVLASGGHVLYWTVLGGEPSVEPITADVRGALLVAMIACWLGLIATVEIGSSRLLAGLDEGKLRDPARAALPWYRTAAAIATLVAIVAGLLAAGVGA